MVWGSLACAPQPSSLRFRAGELQGLSASQLQLLKPTGPGARARYPERPAHRSWRAGSAPAPLEKACVQPQRLGAAQINEFKN